MAEIVVWQSIAIQERTRVHSKRARSGKYLEPMAFGTAYILTRLLFQILRGRTPSTLPGP